MNKCIELTDLTGRNLLIHTKHLVSVHEQTSGGPCFVTTTRETVVVKETYLDIFNALSSR